MTERDVFRRQSRQSWPSAAQRRVLDALAQGKTNVAIAAKLGISFETVKWHISQLLAEVGVADRGELARWWHMEEAKTMLEAGNGYPVRSLTPLLNVQEASRSVKFYTENFGFAVDRTWEWRDKLIWAHLSRGPISLMINASEARDARGAREAPRSYDDVILYFYVDDAQAVHQDLESKGWNPGPLEPQHYGLNEFTVRDPDGYELGFASPIRE